MRGGVLLALTLLPAGAVAEGGPSAESVARLTQAIAAAGCVITVVNQPVILAEAEMDETEAGVIVSWLVAQGLAQLEHDRMRLTSDPCH